MSSKTIALLILLCSLFQINFIHAPQQNQTINAVIGDVSFLDKFGRLPDNSDSEIIRIITHLEYVTSILESKDISHLTNEQLENRKHLIYLLKRYKEENAFPKNYKYQNERRPTFIDKHGNICAVGYLVQQTSGPESAELINKKYKYGYVMDMESKLLDNWLNEHGLTKMEAAMIQPQYGPIIDPEPREITVNSVSTSYGVSSGVLMGWQAAFTGLSFVKTNTYNTNIRLTITSLGLAIISVTNGVYQLDRSTRTYTDSFGDKIRETNVSKRNLSIVNIAFGSASIAFNTYRALHLKKERDSNRFAIRPSVEYLPGLTEPIPTASLALRF